MKTTVSPHGEVQLPEQVRVAANIQSGDVLEVECQTAGRILLSATSKPAGAPRESLPPLFTFAPFPPGALTLIYQDDDPVWSAAEAAARLAQSAPRFEE